MKKNSQNKELEIIQKIVNGDTSLFKELVNVYKDKSLSLTLSIIKNNDEAQDVLQDAFIKVYKNLYKFNFNSSFSTWLYRIVINTCYTALERNEKKKTTSFEKIVFDIPSDMNSFNLLETNHRKEIVNTVLNTLKSNEALILRLFYLGEQSINEVSDITGISVSNVKVLLHRARKNFHNSLDKLMGPEKKYLYE